MRALILSSMSVCLMLSACATSPVATSEALAVPQSRVHDMVLTKPSSKAGVVIVKRDSGFVGSMCDIRVFVNGRLVADLDPKEKITLYLAPGPAIISAQPNNPCAGGMVEAEANVKTERPLTYRVGYGSNGDFGLYPTAF